MARVSKVRRRCEFCGQARALILQLVVLRDHVDGAIREQSHSRRRSRETPATVDP
jgi:ribosomal protein S14